MAVAGDRDSLSVDSAHHGSGTPYHYLDGSMKEIDSRAPNHSLSLHALTGGTNDVHFAMVLLGCLSGLGYQLPGSWVH